MSKNSIEIGAYNELGKLISVGNVTVPEKYKSQIKVGAVVRVRYLYATEGKQLYQPNLDPDDDGAVVRDDISQQACKLADLKYEGKGEIVEHRRNIIV